MKLALVYSRASIGMTAPLVTVEVHLSNGLPALHIVGLPETAVKESKERVRSAIMNTHFEFPIKRITINLAPADLPKEGARFDLPIALGILAASGQIPIEKLAQFEFSGELALSGELRPVRAVLPIVLAAMRAERTLIIPQQNARDAAVAQNADVLTANHILEVCAFLQDEGRLQACSYGECRKEKSSSLDLSEVKGQLHAKRALEIAAAGRHSLLLIGPPGTGKTMLASRLSTILPNLSDDEALEVATIASLSKDGFDVNDWKQTPFRAPHHTSSSVALVGGGRPPKPGEISLAHHGVLFLDELPEFKRHSLECLREPIESGQITISRAAFQTCFPANFQLIAAMNPCPCGFAGIKNENCQCSDEQVKRYMAKISGPLLDRIDMQVAVNKLPAEILINSATVNESVVVKERVIKARDIQLKRQASYNADLTIKDLERVCQFTKEGQQFIHRVMKSSNCSARVYHRFLKIARTIADLSKEFEINQHHFAEAVQLRFLDHKKML